MRNICIAIAMLLVSSACNDWLDVQPKSQLGREELFDDYAGFKDALTGCYMSMCSSDVYGQMLTMQVPDIMAQIWTVNPNGDYSTYRMIANYDYPSDVSREVFQTIWGGLYRVIVQANAILEKIEAKAGVFPSEREKAIVEAETRAIRACCHLDVLRLFGQMPQGGTVEKKLPYTEDVSREAKTYYSYSEFCEKLEADLNRAADLLKEYDVVCEDDNWTKWGLTGVGTDKLLVNRDLHFNYFAVKALQARYYLYTGKTGEAYSAAKEVVEHPYAGKLADNSDYTKGYYTNPSEALFHLNRSDWNNIQNQLVFGSFDRREAPIYVPETRLKELYPNYTTDNRYKLFNLTKVNNGDMPQPILQKYFRNDNLVGSSPSDDDLIHRIQVIPILRASEMYLIVMETSEDLDEINRLYYDYMAHRNVLVDEHRFDSREEVREEVLDEYRREFYGEGQLFFVYKRTGAASMKWGEGNVGENQYIVPIPQTEYSAN